MHPCRPSSEGRYHEPDNYPSVNKRSTAVIQPGAASSCVCLQRWEEQTKGTPALIARQDEIPETFTFQVLILVLVEVALREGRSQYFCNQNERDDDSVSYYERNNIFTEGKIRELWASKRING